MPTKPFYVEFILSRWGSNPVSFSTQEAAERCAQAATDCAEAIVWDCSDSPRGTRRATYRRGVRIETCAGNWNTKCLRPTGHQEMCHPLG